MKKGDVIEFKQGILAGGKAVILRVSKRTGGLTVELVADKGAFKKGETVHVAQYDVLPAMIAR
jgi:transcription antitermination factor NusG